MYCLYFGKIIASEDIKSSHTHRSYSMSNLGFGKYDGLLSSLPLQPHTNHIDYNVIVYFMT